MLVYILLGHSLWQYDVCDYLLKFLYFKGLLWCPANHNVKYIAALAYVCLLKQSVRKWLILVSQYDYPPLNKLGWLCRQTALKFIFSFILLITNNHKHYWIIMYPLTAMQSMFSTTVISTHSTSLFNSSTVNAGYLLAA